MLHSQLGSYQIQAHQGGRRKHRSAASAAHTLCGRAAQQPSRRVQVQSLTNGEEHHASLNNTEPSTSGEQQGTQHPRTSRRALGAAVAAAAAGLLSSAAALPAHALKTVTLKDGSTAEVFEHGMSLAIVALRGSVPQQWIADFKATLGKYAGFSLGQRAQLLEIYKELGDPVDTSNSCSTADVVSLGDAWLGPAIRRGLVQPIPNAESYRWWRYLSPRWQDLVRRNAQGAPDSAGQVYAAPYRWGATLIACRQDRLLRRGGSPVTDWADLLQPALKGKVAMVESSREFVGVALKTLGQSFNASASQLAAAGIGAQELGQALAALRGQVLLLSSRDHIRALTAGDVLAVVGWSQDLITLGERTGGMQVVVPSSGTALFADLWVVPSGAQGGNLQSGPSPLLPSWLEFGVLPGRASSLPNLKSGATPALLPSSSLHAAGARHHHGLGKSHQVSSSSSSAQAQHHQPGDEQQGFKLLGRRWGRSHTAHAEPSAGAKSLDPAAGAAGLAAAGTWQGTVETGAGASLSSQHQPGGGVVNHASGFMPSDRITLERSEFLLPLDEATLQLYKDALDIGAALAAQQKQNRSGVQSAIAGGQQ